MAQSTQPISPLRQRMIEDMRLRKLAPKTQASYICAVKKLADYLGHSPHTATAEDLRRFQLHLRIPEHRVSRSIRRLPPYGFSLKSPWAIRLSWVNSRRCRYRASYRWCSVVKKLADCWKRPPA